MNNNDLLNKYKRGIINNKEYEMLSNKKKYRNMRGYNKKVSLDTLLSNKLDKEYEDFCKRLMKEDKSKIMNSAYEITVKEELKDEIKNMDLHDEEKEIMLIVDDLLNEFYHDWLDCDTPLGESLRDNLQESVAALTRYIVNPNNRNIDKER